MKKEKTTFHRFRRIKVKKIRDNHKTYTVVPFSSDTNMYYI